MNITPQAILVIPASDVLSQDEMEKLSNSSEITWGDADKTLIKVSRLVPLLTKDSKDIEEDHPFLAQLLENYHNCYIDLEN